MSHTTSTRRGFTLPELMMSMAIMGMIVASLMAMGDAVYVSSEYSLGRSHASEQSRIAVSRIERAVHEAYTTPSFPSAGVMSTMVGSWRFPDTLIVWRPRVTPSTPDAEPFNADGPPRMNEIVVFCPNPDDPSELLEITAADDNTTALNVATLATSIAALKESDDADRVVLSDLLCTGTVSEVADSRARGRVRFEVVQRPSSSEIASTDWDDVAWVQGVASDQFGLAQIWVRFELQLWSTDSEDSREALPFFGSAAVYYKVEP
jgi:prepilin-type N-terminal cleavage/methylation domain-containing protein